MSDEKIDLSEIIAPDARDEARFVVVRRDRVLALMALARAAMKFSNSGHVADRMALDAALAPFTDSAEVRSDGE